MVSYFSENFGARVNPYNKYSLAEACYVAESTISEMASDLQMSILLNEHAYLLENGYEISYMTEAEEKSLVDKLKEKGEKIKGTASAIKNKVSVFIKTAITTIADMLDRFVTWVAAKVQELVAKTANIRKETMAKGESIASDADIEKRFINKDKAFYAPVNDWNTFKDLAGSKFIKDLSKAVPEASADSIFRSLVKRVDKADQVRDIYNTETIQGVLKNGNGNNVVKAALDAKKSATKALNDAYKAIANKSEEEVAGNIDNYSKAIKYNVAVSHGYIKAWTSFVNNCAAVARFYVALSDKTAIDTKVQGVKNRVDSVKKALTKKD